jgi:hypothetical protein
VSSPDTVSRALEEIRGSTARQSRLIVEAGPVYLLFVREGEGSTLRFETVASHRLPPELKLSSARAARLRQLGFSKRDGAHRNWVKTIEHPDYEGIAREAAQILREVYGVERTPELALTEDDREHPTNPALVDAMRKVAKGGFDEDLRRAMYTELVNAVLLVPLDPEASDSADEGEEYHVLETFQHKPVLGAFTDWNALRLWEPRGWDYLPVHGSELFENAMHRGIATLKINPNGDIGGELYRHEVEMLVEAVRKFRRKHFN